MNIHDTEPGQEAAAEDEAGATVSPEAGEDAPVLETEDASTPASEAQAEESPQAEPGDGAAGPEARDVARTRALFTRSEASAPGPAEARFRFARWTKPIAIAAFGLSEESEAALRAGFREAAAQAGHEITEQDPELGANLLVFFCEDWSALNTVPHLDRLIPDLERLTRLLAVSDANQHRVFTFGPEHGVRFCVVLLRYDGALAQLSAQALALGQAVQSLLLWSDEAFLGESPVTLRRGGKPMIRSRVARLLKAAYAPETPAYSEDPALAEALTARMNTLRAAESSRRSEPESAEAEPATPEAAQAAPAPAHDPLGADPRPEPQASDEDPTA